nr:hypothetical protein CFP56_32342 [Quercus suber]
MVMTYCSTTDQREFFKMETSNPLEDALLTLLAFLLLLVLAYSLAEIDSFRACPVASSARPQVDIPAPAPPKPEQKANSPFEPIGTHREVFPPFSWEIRAQRPYHYMKHAQQARPWPPRSRYSHSQDESAAAQERAKLQNERIDQRERREKLLYKSMTDMAEAELKPSVVGRPPPTHLAAAATSGPADWRMPADTDQGKFDRLPRDMMSSLGQIIWRTKITYGANFPQEVWLCSTAHMLGAFHLHLPTGTLWDIHPINFNGPGDKSWTKYLGQWSQFGVQQPFIPQAGPFVAIPPPVMSMDELSAPLLPAYSPASAALPLPPPLPFILPPTASATIRRGADNGAAPPPPSQLYIPTAVTLPPPPPHPPHPSPTKEATIRRGNDIGADPPLPSLLQIPTAAAPPPSPPHPAASSSAAPGQPATISRGDGDDAEMASSTPKRLKSCLSQPKRAAQVMFSTALPGQGPKVDFAGPDGEPGDPIKLDDQSNVEARDRIKRWMAELHADRVWIEGQLADATPELTTRARRNTMLWKGLCNDMELQHGGHKTYGRSTLFIIRVEYRMKAVAAWARKCLVSGWRSVGLDEFKLVECGLAGAEWNALVSLFEDGKASGAESQYGTDPAAACDRLHGARKLFAEINEVSRRKRQARR